jgi:hypothetical protein
MSDGLQAVLDASKLSKAQRAGLWDLYQAAKNEDDLDARLKSLDIPKDIKADLWDLKHSASSASAPNPEPTKPVVSEGYWEDRGIAGKVWHPASGVKERARADNQVLGMPPELAALGAGAVGRAVVAPGLNAAGRVAAGAVAAAGQAAPILKYEVAHQGLKAIGVPEPLATAGAVLVGGYKRGGAIKEAAKEVAPAAEAVAVETTPMGFPKAEPPMTPLEVTRKLRAEHQAKNIPPFSPATTLKAEIQSFAKQASETVGNKTKLTASETALGFKLMRRGLSADETMELLRVRRSLPEAWRKLPTDEEVEAIVTRANQTGRMTR